MRSRLRAHVWVLALLAGVLVSLTAAAAAEAASFGVERFVATNCKAEFKKCGGEEFAGPLGTPYSIPKKEITVAEAHEQGFTQAGGRVPFGVTDFKVTTTGEYPDAVPTGVVNHVRVDVAPGLATAPVAVPMCSLEEFGAKEAIPGSGFYAAPTCKASTEIGEEKVTLYLGPNALGPGVSDLPIEGKVYNLAQPEGLASYYGAALEFPKPVSKGSLEKAFAEHPLEMPEPEKKATEEYLENQQYYVHAFIKGSVEWGKEAKGTDAGDYHDYFEVEVSPALPLISSRQELYGTNGEGDFITNGTNCPGNHTTFVTLKDTAGETARESFTTPIGLEGCEKLLFEPAFELTSGSALSDQPNPITTEVTEPNEPEKLAQSQVRTATIALPPEMTLDPSAAAGLEDCTVAQARIHSEEFGTACPESSKLGSVSLDVPTLPAGSLTGSVYLGGPVTGPESGPITGPPYIIYVVANSKRYGISVRLKGEVIPNEATGQLTTVFNENPEQPFSDLAIHFDRGALTSVANPLICTPEPRGATSFVATSTSTAARNAPFGVPITGCAASIPFSLSQSTAYEPASAGGHNSYTFNLTRPEGQQYLQKVTTTLPEGVVGEIPDVTLCGEPQAAQGTCSAASKIGTATVLAGSGNSPYSFSGPVYMTGPYNGAPFGLSIAVPAVAGPFNLGTVVSRSTINVNETTSRVTAESVLPTIVKGVPIRLRSLTVNVNRQGFLLNPTNCSVEETETTLTSTFGGIQSGLNSPFQAEGCSSLGFKPAFTASTSAKHSKTNGASLVTTLTAVPGQANVKSVLVTLPKALPSRLTTLQKACLAKVFEANPYNCKKESPGSEVGSATALTPTLPGVMKGPAYLVSHGGESFPSLELVLEDDGVRVILEGKTDIKKGITTTNFESTPDVPVSSVTVTLPMGEHSALTTEKLNTNLCTANLVMATKIVGQNGKEFKQNTVIAPSGCGVQVVGHKVVGNTAYLTIKTFAAGRISASGSGLKTVYKTLGAASKAVSLKVPLGSRGRARRRPFSVKIRVGFVPKKKGAAHSSTSVKVKFRR